MRREVIQKIVKEKKGKGTVEDLLQTVNQTDFDQFCLMGLIKRGVASINDEPVQTWAMTESLKDEYEFFYGTLDDKEKTIANHFAPARFNK